ncbi:hypothetical protein VTL71DRAFT_2864 [Oculimacula yallundae]|uniref:Uncharacterized protein n=1 Tax=Oculimacula yallundae TaxID=86028 RepID=A0ABR4C5K0_9HELO
MNMTDLRGLSASSSVHLSSSHFPNPHSQPYISSDLLLSPSFITISIRLRPQKRHLVVSKVTATNIGAAKKTQAETKRISGVPSFKHIEKPYAIDFVTPTSQVTEISRHALVLG